MNLTCIVFGIIFMLSGILFAAGKLHVHSTPWKTMSSSEKARIRIVPLCRNIGCMILISGIIFTISGIVPSFREHFFVWSMICWLVLAGSDVYYIGKSRRYINRQEV